MKTTLIITDPHGAQEITEIPGNEGLSVGNGLFRLEDKEGKRFLIMTGEELTSLSNLWLNFVKKNS